jgi:hypothetical protein
MCQIDTNTCQRTPIWCIVHPNIAMNHCSKFQKNSITILKIGLFLYLQSVKDIDLCDPDNDHM